MKIYWIWAPTNDLRIGITEDGRLVSTKSTTAKKEPAPEPVFEHVTDEDINEFKKKKKTEEIKFIPGELPEEYIKETYAIIDEYYRTVKDYEPSIVTTEPENIKSLPHGPHYIVTPPLIQTDEAATEKIRNLISKISKKSREINIPQEKLQELLEKLIQNGLTFYKMETTTPLDNTYFYFNCCGFRWSFTSVKYKYMLATGNIEKTRLELAFSPRNDIDIIMFYKKMRENRVHVTDLEEFRKEFEETLFVIPTGNIPKSLLEKEKMNILARSEDYVKEIAYMINQIAKIWLCVFGQ